MDRTISPPPSKRRKLSTSGLAASAGTAVDVTICSWNVNGIAPFLQRPITSFFARPSGGEIYVSLRDILRRHAWPSMFFLQEVKIAPSDSTTIRAVEKALRANDEHDEPDYIVRFCLPTDKYNARGFGRKIYGVCSFIRRDFYESQVVRVRPVTWDEEGRFLVVETRATKNAPKLAILNVYAVNGTDHPYRDSHTGEVKGTRHDRKLEVHRQLADEVHNLEEHGFGVVVAGDINIARSKLDGRPNLRTLPYQHCLNREDFERRFMLSNTSNSPLDDHEQAHSQVRLGMIDTFRHLHPDTLSYTYHPRDRKFGESCDRVDMILVSSRLKDHLMEAKILDTVADRGPSDHVPLMASFKFDSTLKHHIPDL